MKNGIEDISRLEAYKKENLNRLTEEQFEILEQEILHPKKGTISDARLDFRLWCEGLLSGQKPCGATEHTKLCYAQMSERMGVMLIRSI